MRQFLYACILFLSFNSIFAQIQVLPRWMTEEEKAILPYYQAPLFSGERTDPPLYAVRTMAEWEELRGIIITWASFQSILRQIVDYAQEEGIVYIICSDSNSVKSYLQSGGVPL